MADEKKRIIDLSELSQEVQVGQYILVDSASGAGKMDLKKIVDDSTTSLAERVTDLETGLTEEENARIAADTELSGNVSNLQTVLETKADNNGYYPDLYAGNLSSTKKQTDSTPYLMRKTGGDLSRIGEREHDTLVGATVNVNQLVDTDTSSVTIQSGHKYYAKISGTESIGASTGTAISVTGGTDMVIDLTAKFGSTIADYLYSLETATAGAGIAKLREWGFLTGGYIPYNTGTLESVEATAHKMVGFNQWDEETRNGYYSTDGSFFPNTSYTACKNLIPVLPSTLYNISCDKKNIGRLCFYNSAESFISTITGISSVSSYEFTTPTNAAYMSFDMTGAYGATYNHDICINLSSDRNGEYEPYSAHTYDLGTDTLRGLFKLDSNNNLYADGDTKTSDGTVTRKYGEETYNGAELWTMDSNIDAALYHRFYVTASVIKRETNYTGKILNSRGYPSAAGYTRVYEDIGQYAITAYSHASTSPGQNWLYVFVKKGGTITDITSFKSWLSSNPITVVYELATPTTETSTPFQNPQICDPDGTEEYVTSNGVPVGHETEYDYDIKGLAEELIDVPDVPSSNGTYVLKATRTADGLSYSWVAG